MSQPIHYKLRECGKFDSKIIWAVHFSGALAALAAQVSLHLLVGRDANPIGSDSGADWIRTRAGGVANLVESLATLAQTVTISLGGFFGSRQRV